MRKLASIQIITALEPIEGADAIERAQVLGWSVVVKKGEFNVGDFVVYCEIDSVLPAVDEFAFLEKVKYRIKTIRLRGQISQGICFPTSILPKHVIIEEDRNVTKVLGVTKYEPPIPNCLSGIQKGTFPCFISKTDETRVQTLQNMLNKYQGTKSYVSLKLDGSSATYYYAKGEFGVCSRSMELHENEDNTFWAVARRDGFEEKLKSISELLNCDVAIQGELVGPGIQKNRLGLKQHEVFVFNLFSITEHNYFSGMTIRNICDDYGLQMVPVLDWEHTIHNDVQKYIDTYNDMTHGMYQNNQIEGVVIRPLKEIYDNYHGRISFKVINNNFLLKHED